MSQLSKDERIALFMSLFHGRSDAFAQRWEKRAGSFSGYFPAYTDRTKKNLAPLSPLVIEAHLLGNKVIGVYPLQTDNSSYFIAADFDGNDWLGPAKRVLETFSQFDLPAYIERSRSGSGGHVWWFFEDKYPAYKGRKIFLRLLKESGVIAPFDKEDSFDRLFPSQDYLSGKGFGNLIALPLQGIPRKSGNSVFLDPSRNFELASDQWEFLRSVKRVPIETLDRLYSEFTDKKAGALSMPIHSSGSEIPVAVSNFIAIPKSSITKDLANFLADRLNFFNTEYAVKEKMGLSNYQTEKYFKTIVDGDADVFLPRGFLDQLLGYCEEHNIRYTVIDDRLRLEPVKLTPTFTLHEYQKEAIDAFKNHDQGILVAPPGSGKTIMGLALIAEKSQPALILTHRKQIYDQWLDRIASFFSIPKRNIGQIAGIKKEVKSPITVAMIQSLARIKSSSKLVPQFGTVLVDECHHVPAKMFRKVVTQFNPRYLCGLTATPIRKHNDEKLIFIYLGDVIYEVPGDFVRPERPTDERSDIQVIIRDTSLLFPHKVKSQDYQLLARVLTFDTHRNQLVAVDISSEANAGKKCLVLTERKEHIEILSEYLKQDFELIALSGDLTPKQRREKIAQIQSGHYQIILATGQLIGEGTHFDSLDCLFLVYPFSFEGKLIQYIGRLLHSQGIKKVYDYRDLQVEYLERMFKKRNKYYDKHFGGNTRL